MSSSDLHHLQAYLPFFYIFITWQQCQLGVLRGGFRHDGMKVARSLRNVAGSPVWHRGGTCFSVTKTRVKKRVFRIASEMDMIIAICSVHIYQWESFSGCDPALTFPFTFHAYRVVHMCMLPRCFRRSGADAPCYHSCTSPGLGCCTRTILSQLSRHSGSKACFICACESVQSPHNKVVITPCAHGVQEAQPPRTFLIRSTAFVPISCSR